jgi:hypothetical protein
MVFALSFCTFYGGWKTNIEMSTSPWSNLTPREFEEFCFVLLECNDFTNLSWYGGQGADKGRDIMCTKLQTPLPGVSVAERWLVQCKHYKTSRLSKAVVLEWLAACREHKPNQVLLIISQSLGANMKDWLASVAKDYPFSLHLWEEAHLNGQYYRHGPRLRRLFPHLPKATKKILLYHTEMSQVFIGCNEFSEIGFWILNDYGPKMNMAAIQEFIDFIKANDFKFDLRR